MDAETIRRLPFHAPRLHAPVSVDAHVRFLRPDAKVKGLFISDALALIARSAPGQDPAALAGIPSRRYLPFSEYPYPDYLRVVMAAGKICHPTLPIGRAIFEVGHRAYAAFTENQVGKVLFGVLGRDFDAITKLGARAWQVSTNFGQVEYVRLGEKHAAYTFHEFPGFIETLQAGVVQGALAATRTHGEVRVHLDSLQNGVVEVRWQ